MNNIINAIILLTFAFVIHTVASERDDLKKQAIERGFAEYIQSNGQVIWKWKEAAK